MSTVLEQALEELKAMPAEAQESIAQDLLDLIRSERKWDKLFADPRSDRVFEQMSTEVRAENAAGKAIAADPSFWRNPLRAAQ